jgi:ABC-type branched-subunit amino acid transport system ATPase component/ABC-type branched-subunit amino acid transport system permease subunit
MTSGTFLIGLLNGLTISLLAIGLVLIYKSNRFVNLAQAQMGTLSALLLEKWVLDQGWNWWLASAAAVLVGILTGVVVQRTFIRTLAKRTRSAVTMLLMTVGISQLLLALTYFPALTPNLTTANTLQYPQAFASHVNFLGVELTASSLLTLILAPILVVGLESFLRFSQLGKEIRAAASNQDAASLCGISIDRTQMITWGIAGGLAAVSALLAAPTQGSLVGSSLGPSLLVVALGAAACGAFVSIPAALVGALVLGVGTQVVAAVTNSGGDAQLAQLLLILAIILVRGKAIARVFAASGPANEPKRPLRIPSSLMDAPIVKYRTLGYGTLALILGVLMPFLPFFSNEGDRFLLVLILTYSLVAVSLTILVGWAGQVSLGQFALVGAGAYMTARFAPHNWTLLGLILFAGTVGALVMVIVGLPALRVRGLMLAVTTLAYAVVAPTWLFRQSWFGQNTVVGSPIPAISLARGLGAPQDELWIYMVALGLLVIVMIASLGLRRHVPGRLIMAVRDNENAAAAFGISPLPVKMAALATSGFIAAAAGVVWADAWHVVSIDQFGPELSVAAIALPVLGGLGSLGGAVAAAWFLYLPTFFLAPHLSGIFGQGTLGIGFALAVSGVALIWTLLQNPAGIAGTVQDVLERILAAIDRRRAGQSGASPAPVPVTAPSRAPMALSGLKELSGTVPAVSSGVAFSGGPVLEVADVTVHFGGIQALEGASIRVEPGEIVGLIGPNGAGKTSLINVISGLLRADSGSVKVYRNEVVDLPSDIRAAFGLARSFQDATLFPGLTVGQTIQVALSYRSRVGFMASLLWTPWARFTEQSSQQDAGEIMGGLGLAAWAGSLTSELSTGTRRICDLAAQIASQPKILLLDEPTAGIAQREAEAFGPLLSRIRDELDCAILVVEHDMPLLMGLCDRVYAMESGRIIASGTPGEVRNDPDVVASYLGTNGVAISRSGRRMRPSKSPAGVGSDSGLPESRDSSTSTAGTTTARGM